MIVVFTTLAIAMWLVLGATGFAYWWNSEFGPGNHKTVRGTQAFASLMGPFAWGAGYLIHGRN